MSHGCCSPKTYAPRRIFECCQTSNCTQFEIKPGQVGTLNIYDAPEGFCFSIDRVVFDRCCKNPHYAPVPDPCCECECTCALEMYCGQSVDLPAGTYRICIHDEDCEPVSPDTGEVIAELTQNPC